MLLVHGRAGIIMESDLAKSMTTGNGKHGNGCPRSVVRRKRTCRFVVTCSSLPAKLSWSGPMSRREPARSGYSPQLRLAHFAQCSIAKALSRHGLTLQMSLYSALCKQSNHTQSRHTIDLPSPMAHSVYAKHAHVYSRTKASISSETERLCTGTFVTCPPTPFACRVPLSSVSFKLKPTRHSLSTRSHNHS